MKKLFSIVMAVCVIFAITGCGNGSTSSGGGPGNGPFTVTYNANGWTGGGIPARITVAAGEAIGAQAIIPLEETDAQTCLGWSLTAGQGGARITADYKVTGNITLYALWQALVPEGDPVTITYNANGWLGGGVPTDPASGVAGSPIGAANLPVLEDSNGQIFWGWAITSGSTGARITGSYTLRGHTTLYVLWTSPVMLSFDYNFDGAPAVPQPIEVGSGIPIGNVLPAVVDSDNPVEGEAPTRPDYLFQGWYTAPDGGTRITNSSIFTESATLYAQWAEEPAWGWLDLDLNMLAVWQANNGTTWTSTAIAEPSYTDEGWLNWKFTVNDSRGLVLFSTEQKEVLKKISSFRLFVDGEVTSGNAATPFRFFIGTPDTGSNWNGTNAITQGAFSTQLVHNVEFNSSKNQILSDGDPPQQQEPRIQAYILQVRSGGEITVTIKSIRIRYDQSIGGLSPTAPVDKISYDRNYDGAPTGPNPAILSRGDQLGKYYQYNTLPVVNRALHQFSGWYTEKTGGTKVEPTTTFTTSTTLYAQWQELETVTISYDLGYSGGPQPPEPVDILKDAAIGAVNLPAITRVGYFFDGWYTASTGGTKVLATDTFAAAATLYAQWEDATGQEFTVTFNKGYTDGSSSVITTVDVDVFDTLGSAMPSDPSRTDFEFIAWYTGLTTGTVFKNDTVVAADITVYARWAYVGTADWEEKVTIVNGSAPVYAFELPTGDTFGNYDSVKFLMKLDTAANSTISARKRAWGNYDKSWLDGLVTARPGMANATPGGLLLNAFNGTDGVESFDYSDWTEVTISFSNRDTLSSASVIKSSTGIILLGVSFIPAGGSTGTYVYHVKSIRLVDSSSVKSDVSALHPASKKLWNGQGASAYVTQDGNDVPTRVWSFVE